MIARIIEWSLRNRFLVVCATLIVAAWGVKALRSTPIDAIPDLSEEVDFQLTAEGPCEPCGPVATSGGSGRTCRWS